MKMRYGPNGATQHVSAAVHGDEDETTKAQATCVGRVKARAGSIGQHFAG